ncbi:MAG: methyltransferase domain-containing protein [Pseudomonadota bacterium]
MRPDIADLRQFYATPQGRLAARLIARRMAALRPTETNLRILGLGYPCPFLSVLADGAERVVTFMPHEQGVGADGGAAGNRAAMVNEAMLPLPDRSVDVVLLAHAVETTDRVNRLLREVWRVLDDGGRLMAIVPNRRGLWCFAESTPFGHGKPYSASQLRELLRTNLFDPARRERALYVPPFKSRLWLRTGPTFERFGQRFGGQLSGVILIEAQKTTVSATPVLADAGYGSLRVRALPMRGVAARQETGDEALGAAAPGRPTTAARAIAFTPRRRRR